jgi:hypothetical protein
LKKEDVRLLDFGSRRFERELGHCGKLISSHMDNYITRHFSDIRHHMRFVYLRHGYIQVDISGWVNSKKIDLFLTAIPAEADGIMKEGSPFHLSAKQVRLTGYPRHDALLRGEREDEAVIAVMPTWRKFLVGETVGKGNRRTFNANFVNSGYAARWGSLLRSGGLARLARVYGYRVVFYPHINMQPYLAYFRAGPEIEVAAYGDAGIQSLFRRARIMITDYSSVAFESAYLSRSVLYYQFDRTQWLAGHLGGGTEIFDYQRDGFGPVAVSEELLLAELEALLRRGGKPDSVYLERMRKAFPFRDGHCCERVLNEILRLDEPASRCPAELYPSSPCNMRCA